MSQCENNRLAESRGMHRDAYTQGSTGSISISRYRYISIRVWIPKGPLGTPRASESGESREEICVHCVRCFYRVAANVPAGARSRPADQRLAASCGTTLEPRDKTFTRLAKKSLGGTQGFTTSIFTLLQLLRYCLEVGGIIRSKNSFKKCSKYCWAPRPTQLQTNINTLKTGTEHIAPVH